MRGDENACKTLYEKTIPYVYSIVKRYINNAEERKDLTQDVYAKVFINLKSYNRKHAPFKFWLRKVTINTCLMHLRKNENTAILQPVGNHNGFSFSEEDRLHTLTREDIEGLLDHMPEGYKMIFMLSVIDGYDHKEISQLLNISVQTSRSQLSRAKNWIRKKVIPSKEIKAYGIQF